MENSLITLTTDFGEGSPYAGAMQGVILSINPSARVVSLSHAVPPHDIAGGAWILSQTAVYFPEGTIHIAVVDPGVGSSRSIVYAEMASHRFIAPDNGLLGLLAVEHPPSKIIQITNSEYWLPHGSATFHGRDIMAPVAAHLSLGLVPEALGPATAKLADLAWPEVRRTPHSVDGEVIAVDRFGNLITNITQAVLSGAPRDGSITIHCEGQTIHGLSTTYSDQPPRTLIALFGSSGQLELAVVEENAAAMLNAKPGSGVSIAW
ncbi:MAG: SAM-dependent chlorinase/fluorinase [Pirellulales bacterium]|nr:SAM-dependent chlorinase/fluorinase [Pirellulales bacterium]